MKTALLILAGCLLMTISLSAQIRQHTKTDSIKTGFNSFQHILTDTLKLTNPFAENQFQAPVRKYNFPRQNQNIALNSNSNFRMPVYHPEVKSKMPVKRPDPSVQFFLQIKKID